MSSRATETSSASPSRESSDGESSRLRSVLRRLPAMDRLLAEPGLRDLEELYGRDALRIQAREALDEVRSELARRLDGPPGDAGDDAGADAPGGESDLDETVARAVRSLPGRIRRRLHAALGPGLRRVINATGIFVHTNLGRAPLPADLAAQLQPLLAGYCDLEMSLDSGARSERNRHVAPLLLALCAPDDEHHLAALVTNNNAAALVLALAALTGDRPPEERQVIVSRGELVEIGGSFRIPDILRSAGATLHEVGTTNRTRLEDYRRAVGPETALLLKVHTSNYRIRGFTAEVPAAELAELGRETGIPVMVDEGSGLLRDSEREPIRDHRSLAGLLADGADLVCGSGDKLLGGPQAGLLLGRCDLVERCRRHPLYRALRPDVFTYAALEGLLRRHLSGAPLPLDRLWPDPAVHRRRLDKLAETLRRDLPRDPDARIEEADAYVGGGSAPDRPVRGEALTVPGSDDLLTALRRNSLRSDDPPVVAYLRGGRLVIDLRTVDEGDDEALARVLVAALSRRRGEDGE